MILSRIEVGSGLVTRRGQWRPGGWQNGRCERSHRSGLQCATSPSAGKRESRFVTLAIHPLAVVDWSPAAATGRDGRRDALLGQHLTDFVPVIPLIPHHRGRRWQSLRTPSAPVKPLHCPSSGGVAGDHLCCHRPHGACWSCPPWCHQSGGGHPPLLRLDAVGWALMSVASIIRTSGSVTSGGSAESGGFAASDADNSEKISSKTPLSHQRRQRL